MSSRENLHISIGGMLDYDVSRMRLYTRNTNTRALLDVVKTLSIFFVWKAQERRNKMPEGKWKTELFFILFMSFVSHFLLNELNHQKIDFSPT